MKCICPCVKYSEEENLYIYIYDFNSFSNMTFVSRSARWGCFGDCGCHTGNVHGRPIKLPEEKLLLSLGTIFMLISGRSSDFYKTCNRGRKMNLNVPEIWRCFELNFAGVNQILCGSLCPWTTCESDPPPTTLRYWRRSFRSPALFWCLSVCEGER